MEKAEIDREELEKLTVGSLRKAVVEGNTDEGSVMAGQIVGNIKQIRSVEAIIETTIDEYRHVNLQII